MKAGELVRLTPSQAEAAIAAGVKFVEVDTEQATTKQLTFMRVSLSDTRSVLGKLLAAGRRANGLSRVRTKQGEDRVGSDEADLFDPGEN